jgi:hypothetical protein
LAVEFGAKFRLAYRSSTRDTRSSLTVRTYLAADSGTVLVPTAALGVWRKSVFSPMALPTVRLKTSKWRPRR